MCATVLPKEFVVTNQVLSKFRSAYVVYIFISNSHYPKLVYDNLLYIFTNLSPISLLDSGYYTSRCVLPYYRKNSLQPIRYFLNRSAYVVYIFISNSHYPNLVYDHLLYIFTNLSPISILDSECSTSRCVLQFYRRNLL